MDDFQARIIRRRLAEAERRLADAESRGETETYLALARFERDKLAAALERVAA